MEQPSYGVKSLKMSRHLHCSWSFQKLTGSQRVVHELSHFVNASTRSSLIHSAVPTVYTVPNPPTPLTGRLPAASLSKEYILWSDIQDIVGPATFWPQRIRRYFWTRHLTHWERILTATFIWVNGLNPEVPT